MVKRNSKRFDENTKGACLLQAPFCNVGCFNIGYAACFNFFVLVRILNRSASSECDKGSEI